MCAGTSANEGSPLAKDAFLVSRSRFTTGDSSLRTFHHTCLAQNDGFIECCVEYYLKFVMIPLIFVQKNPANLIPLHSKRRLPILCKFIAMDKSETIQEFYKRKFNWMHDNIRNVSEIAYALGFTEVTHFNNFFKKKVNTSPLKFRNV